MVTTTANEDSVEVCAKAAGGSDGEVGLADAAGVEEILIASGASNFGACDPLDACACSILSEGVIGS
jgi:hypothetical protein